MFHASEACHLASAAPKLPGILLPAHCRCTGPQVSACLYSALTRCESKLKLLLLLLLLLLLRLLLRLLLLLLLSLLQLLLCTPTTSTTSTTATTTAGISVRASEGRASILS